MTLSERDGETTPLGLPVAAVARRLGLAPATLRTWDRRYGLGPRDHGTGRHRRYTAEDLTRLEEVRRLVLEGVPPADAARAVLAAGPAPGPAPEPAAEPMGPTPEPAHQPAPGDAPARPGLRAPERSARRAAGSGGRVLALPGAAAAARGLGRAALSLDAAAVAAAVGEEVRRRGVVEAWEVVLRPVLVAVGDRWAATGEGVEVEHLLSDCVSAVLRERARGAAPSPGRPPRPATGRPLLLAGAPDEQHVLPLHVLAAALAERGRPPRVLGPDLPGDALAAAVRRTGPVLVAVWSQRRSTADPAVLDLPTTRPSTAVLAAGPGWDGVDLGGRATHAVGLRHALALVEQVTGAGPGSGTG